MNCFEGDLVALALLKELGCVFAQLSASHSPRLVVAHCHGHVVSSDQDCLVFESAVEVPQG